MKKIASKTVIFLVLVIASVVVITLYGNLLMQCALCAKWHLLDGRQITVGTAKLNIPYNWWVDSKDGKSKFLTRIPPLGYDYFGALFLRETMVNSEELDRYSHEKVVAGKKMVRTGSLRTLNIGSETAYSIEYKYDSTCAGQCTVIWTMAIPSKGILIDAIDIHEEHISLVLSELLSEMR